MLQYDLKAQWILKTTVFHRLLLVLVISVATNLDTIYSQVDNMSYQELLTNFKSPDYSLWGEVPLWWWEADSISKERITWELETLAAKGVKSVCPIQRSPARTYPESFSEKWWDMFEYTHKECKRLGMSLWLYDQVGYGQYGWLEKAAAQVGNTDTYVVEFYTKTSLLNSTGKVEIQIGKGEVLGARAYPVVNNIAIDEESIDVFHDVKDGEFSWNAPTDEEWKVAIMVLEPYTSFYLNEAATDVFIQQLYERVEETVGRDAMGKSFVGIFQDEHPVTPRDLYVKELADTFKVMFGYEIERAIPALHFDVGDKTPMYRNNYFDAYLAIVEKTYWRKIYDWITDRNLLTSHDNWGRLNIYNHSQGYIDYFRTQRWFTAPGFDDWGQNTIENRNYYDTKIASSISRLYNRPRVWAEVFHSSGWGRTTEQNLSWLSALYAFGANIYDEHGLYYALNAGTWEHAAGDPHWRQPYWKYFQEVSNWVTRMSYVMSQGSSVADIAVHYPVTSVLGEIDRGNIDFNYYMKLSRAIFDKGMDNDIIDDESILKSHIESGKLKINGNEYQALVFGAEKTIRLSVLEKCLELLKDGGTVLFFGSLPTATTENGENDEKLKVLLREILGEPSGSDESNLLLQKYFGSGGYAAFITDIPEILPVLLSKNIKMDFEYDGEGVYMAHRKIGDVNVYLLQNINKDAIEFNGRFRTGGNPEIWNAFTGKIQKIDNFEKDGEYTKVNLKLEGNIAHLVVFRPGSNTRPAKTIADKPVQWIEKILSKDWSFSIIPTLDNEWGDFSWPPSKDKIGLEVREFKYKEETGNSGLNLHWYLPGFNDSDWETALYSSGPYWLMLEGIPNDPGLVQSVLNDMENIQAGNELLSQGEKYSWKKLIFSKKIGLGKPSPWGGHSGYPDGHFDKNFINYPNGRKLLFTIICVETNQSYGLNVKLRNSGVRLWVNGEEQAFQGSVGNLPLIKGCNKVLLELPDGEGGELYVQKQPPVLSGANVYPELGNADWIWFGNTEGAYFRKSFDISGLPESAYLTITAVSGFRLFINGQKVEEDIGPWATWKYPKTVDIAPFLCEGKNEIAIWGQFLKELHVSYPESFKGLIAAIKIISETGDISVLMTDKTWKGSIYELEGWNTLNFNDSGWENVEIKGQAISDPWGVEFLKNIGGSTTPPRPLSISLQSPEIEVFDELPDIVYDVKRNSSHRVGWYRFKAPPGLKGMTLNSLNDAIVWVDGNEQTVINGKVFIDNPPSGISTVAIRMDLQRGEYYGAPFTQPIGLELKGGLIQEGSWENFSMPYYSGIGVYKQNISIGMDEIEKKVVLDLGEVIASAEVFVNGKSAGVRVANPFKYDLSQMLKTGENTIEIRVANTLAPHYTVPMKTINLGPTKSGLIGPVELKIAD